MKKYIFLFLLGTLIFSVVHAQKVPTNVGYSASENVKADGFNVYFSGGTPNFSNGQWRPAGMGRVLTGFNPRVVIVPKTFDKDLSVSKGYFDNFVDIKWHVALNENLITRFKIYRKKLGTKDSVEVANLSADTRSWRDEYCETGVLYEYTLFAEGLFPVHIKYKNYINGIGFRIPYGVISGRVTFATGSAVEGVEVMAETDQNFKGSSLYLNGTDAYLAISPKADDTQFDFDKNFTLQAWLKSDSVGLSTLFQKGSQYKITHKQGQIDFTADGQTISLSFPEKVDTFFNVTAMRTVDSLKLFVVYDKKTSFKKSALLTTTAAANSDDIYIGKSGSSEYFKGNIDELRIWHKSFTDEEVYRDVRRYISGSETGITAYYRFNEGLGDAFYDLAREGFTFHKNQGYMYKAQWSDKVPFSKQLAVKGISDENGNYTISGIPYASTGTNYRFIPVFGIHEFDPSEKLLYMGPGSSTHNGINFTDITAFAVKGNVKYKNTNYPVKGANLYIDDKIVVRASGKPVITDGYGNYEISVPIGYHTIKVGMIGHGFKNDGYFPIQVQDPEDDPTYWNFQEPFSGLNFVDTTLVKVIGRVAGGPIEQAKPKGLGKTKNNIGFGQIKMTTQREYDLTDNTVDGVHSQWMNDIYEGDSIANKGETKYDIEALSPKNITIYPDHETGEFVAYLLPEKYIITSVKAGNYNYPESFNTTVDLTTKYSTQVEIDSVQTGIVISSTNDTIKNYRIDSVQYNHNLDLIYREVPSVEVTSKDGNPVFWEKKYKAHNDSVISLVNEDGSLKTAYPVLRQRGLYKLKISVFEKYINSDNSNAINLVPVTDGTIQIQNNLAIHKDARLYPINKSGYAYYTFTGGLPNISTGGIGDYLLTMAIVVKTGQNGSIMTPWLYKGNTFRAYLLGGMPTGSNFVSTGPNELITILRDPPGANSFAYLEKGSEFNTTKSFSVSNELAREANITASFGTKVTTWEGVGAGVIEEAETVEDASRGIQGGTAWGHDGEQNTSISTTQTWSTSDGEDYVGAGGDVFIGYSTNIVYGVSTNIDLIPTDMPQGDGFVGHDFDQNGVTYDIGVIKGIRVNPEFGTMFQYSLLHIESYLIPNLIMLRNNYLQSHSNYHCVVCDPDDENYAVNNTSGKADINGYTGGNSYNYTVPENWDKTKIYIDSVRFYNNQIKDWEWLLRKNEKQKLEADLDKNISFDAGAIYESSETNEESSTETRSFEWNLGGSIGTELGGDVMGIGVTATLETSYNHSAAHSTTNGVTNSLTYGYTLNDGNAGNYLSIDVKKPKASTGPVFITRGGQTMCPYEGATYTEYYNPGTLLSEATMQMEIPKITCENPLQVNVPEDKPAIFEVQLSNESETGDGQWFLVELDHDSNQKGAQVTMDGSPLANGMMVLVNAGETVNKYIYVSKIRDDEYNYNNLGIILASACQSDPTDFQDDIADTVRISASFQPVCTEVNLLSPENQWVINTNGDTTLDVNISGYDYQQSSFNNIALKYKSASTSKWATEMIFYANKDDYDAANEPKIFMNGQANQEYVFDWSSMQDREYNLKATSYCADGTENNSDILNGIKDVKRPMVFGTPQPANGILTSNDDVMITFDEPINAGLLLPYNFSVKGVLNGNKIKHQSCVYFDGVNDYATAIKGVKLDNKSWTIEFWARRGDLTNGVVFAQSGIEIGFNAANKFYLKTGTQTIESDQAINDLVAWKHYAVTYDADTQTFNMYINDNIERENIDRSSAFTANGKMYLGKSPATGDHFNGYIHELRVWGKSLGFGTLYAQMYKTLASNTVGLDGYWPMDAARGNLAEDKARERNALFFGCEWKVFPAGYARTFDGASNIDINTGASVVIPKEADFTLEFYFKGGAQANTVMFSNGKGDGTDIAPAYKNIWTVGFNGNGELYAKNNGAIITIPNKDFLDNQWHHFALVKNEISNSSIYIDGNLESYEKSSLLGGLSGSVMTIGARLEWHFDNNIYDQNFIGAIDEFRIWNLARTKKQLDLDMNSKLRGDEMGLVAYYPFDKYNDLGIALDPTLEDISGQAPNAIANGGDASNVDVPNIKDARPVQNVAFDWVVNKDKVIINIDEQPSLIEKCNLEFTIDRVEDMRENRIASPATWTAFIEQNPVTWDDEYLNIKKEAFKDYNFDVDVLNSSGTEQSYHISGLPSWLSVDMPEGTIDPDSRSTLHFTIDPVVNIGDYDFSLFLESDFGYPEKLNIDLNVFKESPDWKIDPGSFQYSMNVIGQVKINDVISDDPNDIVAAFVDGECRGLANVDYVKAYDNFEVYLNIYSNIPSGENVELRIWDASKGQIITNVQPKISFENNGLMGSPSKPTDIIANAYYEEHLPLKSGWNWVSFNLDSKQLLYSDSLFRSVDLTDNDIIRSSTAFDIYSAASNSWFGTLASVEGITQGENYMIKIQKVDTLVYSGNQIDPATQINLVTGWNWLGYIPLTNMRLTEAFSGFEPSPGDVIKSQDAFAYYDETLGWIGSLKYMRSGIGYLYKSQADVNFTYPTVGMSFKNGSIKNLLTNTDKWTVNRTKYKNSMSFIAKVVGGNFDMKNMVLGAFVENECRGIIEPIEVQAEYKFFLTVYGNEEKNISFKLLDRKTGKQYLSDKIEKYTENAVKGSVSAPIILKFGDAINPNEALAGSLEVYPNPFTQEVQLYLQNVKSIDKIEITNAIGKKVIEFSAINKNNMVWNGKNSSGNSVPAGIYFIRVYSGANVKSTKIIKVK